MTWINKRVRQISGVREGTTKYPEVVLDLVLMRDKKEARLAGTEQAKEEW